jgi:hypothetical protein
MNTRKKGKTQRPYAELRNEDFGWLADLHQTLSPFWTARLGYQEGAGAYPVLKLEKAEPVEPTGSAR